VRPVIILFAKAPVAGMVKTRLHPLLSAEEAAALHEAFVLDTIETLQQLSDVDLELHTDRICDTWDVSGVGRGVQIEGPLQLKLLHAMDRCLAVSRRVFILGTDAPDLPVGHIRELMSLQADVVLGPTEDGGYWGIGAQRTHPQMFEGVAWSSGQEREQTLEACRRCGLSVATGPMWNDVDRPEDLQALLKNPVLPKHTARTIGSIPKLAEKRQTGGGE
jgi:uncharacterized protein